MPLKEAFSAATRAALWEAFCRVDGQTTNDVRGWAMDFGVSDGTNPEAKITREQLVTMLYRYAGSPAVTGDLAAYTDAASVSAWAKDAMTWAVQQGIITGMTQTTLAPAGNATRAQAAALLHRFCENVK